MNDFHVLENILKLLDDCAKKHGPGYGLNPEQLNSYTKVSKEQLNYYIYVLKEQMLVDVRASLGCKKITGYTFNYVTITSKGAIALNHPMGLLSVFNSLFNIQGNNNVIGNNNTISNSFNVVDAVIEESDLDIKTKEDLKAFIAEVVADLKKGSLDDNKVKKFFIDTLSASGKTVAPKILTALIKSLASYFGVNV